MRTNEERARLIRKRTAEIKQENRNRRQRRLEAVCVTACLLAVVAAGALMPHLDITGGEAYRVSGAASLVESHAALGYILMGLLAFLLGGCVTVLLYRIRRRGERQHRKEDSDEL